MNISVLEFLKTGNLGLLRSNMSPDEVATILGAPDAVTKEQKGGSVWRYESLQVYFFSLQLVMAGLYFDGWNLKGTKGSRIIIEEDFAGPPTLVALEKLMARNQVSFGVKPELTFGEQKCLRTSSGVELIFLNGFCEKMLRVY